MTAQVLHQGEGPVVYSGGSAVPGTVHLTGVAVRVCLSLPLPCPQWQEACPQLSVRGNEVVETTEVQVAIGEWRREGTAVVGPH